MKSLRIADKSGIAETELFASTYRSFGTATVRYPVLEVDGTVEPYDNGRGFSLRLHRVGKPRSARTSPPSQIRFHDFDLHLHLVDEWRLGDSTSAFVSQVLRETPAPALRRSGDSLQRR